MTPQEYVDPARFPRTTQAGLTLRQQMFLDAVNMDDVTEARELGREFTAEMLATAAELEEKVKAQSEVLDQAKALGIE